MSTALPQPGACGYCGSYHFGTTCPRVKSIEYHNDGTVKRVEFHPPLTSVVTGSLPPKEEYA